MENSELKNVEIDDDDDEDDVLVKYFYYDSVFSDHLESFDVSTRNKVYTFDTFFL